jgi:signal transduction histidine kinase
MIQLKTKLAIFNLLSKLAFTGLFLIFMPFIVERINLRQVDNDLIQKREKVIGIISEVGIEPFVSIDSSNAFGSYDILKEEFISLEKSEVADDYNFIEVTHRLIDNEDITYRILNYTLNINGQKYLLEIGKSLDSILYARQNISTIILAFLIFIIIITFLTDIQYNRVLLAPLDRITGKLKGISNPSTFDMDPVKTTTSDFYELDKALIEMIKRIDELFLKEKEITVNISHELLTPVSVLRSKLENIFLHEKLDPEVAAKTEESLKTLHRLQRLINSMLFISRIESRQFLLKDSFAVNELLKEVLGEIYPLTEDAGICLKSEFKNDFQIELANRSLIFSMFYNVINNALKNTPSNGLITIRSELANDQSFIVSVSDSGKGMTEEKLSSLFFRFHPRSDDDPDSHGLGLAITKTIADLHNIDLKVISQQGAGTVFSFKFHKTS